MPSKDVKKEKAKAVWWQPALILFFRLSGWIVAPILIGIFLGKWLDRKYNSEPWLFLGSVGLAFIISMTGLIINARREFKKIAEEDLKGDRGKEKKGNRSR